MFRLVGSRGFQKMLGVFMFSLVGVKRVIFGSILFPSILAASPGTFQSSVWNGEAASTFCSHRFLGSSCAMHTCAPGVFVGGHAIALPKPKP